MAEIGRGAYARRMTAAAAEETRTSHRVTRVRVVPAPAPTSLSRQVRDIQRWKEKAAKLDLRV